MEGDGGESVERGRWSVERGRWSVERGRWSLERGRWSVERGRWSVGVWHLQSPQPGLVFGRQRTAAAYDHIHIHDI